MNGQYDNNVLYVIAFAGPKDNSKLFQCIAIIVQHTICKPPIYQKTIVFYSENA